MRKGVIKAIVLTMVFISSVVFFSIVTNQVNEELTTEMAQASLPMISLYTGNTEINELHGYTEEMDGAFMRDTITPISENRMLPVKITTYGNEIEQISYEIRSLNAARLIANANIDTFEQRGEQLLVELPIQNLLEAGQEYLLVICLEYDQKEVYFYTRIIEPVECYVNECLAFAQEFHEATFSKEASENIKMYLEQNTDDNTTLQYTSLNSSLKQVSWANLGGERLTEATPSIKEITPAYMVLSLEYVLTRVDENGTSEYYNVEEHYRVRYTETRMYMLKFERTVNELFRGETAELEGKSIQLGIRSANVEYKSSDTGNIVAFVQEGELWSYNQSENTLAKVFSFRGYEGIDKRENYGNHDIRIVNVDEAGSITYIVYGYMNRGVHEGKVGTAVYRYDSLANTNEEALFISSKQSYEIVKADLGQLMYVNEGSVFFIMTGESVYGIDLNTMEMKEVISDLGENEYAISESNRLFAWTAPGKEAGSNLISIVDLTTERIETISCVEGEYLLPLGFLGEDLVYGSVRSEEVQTDAAGKSVYPIYKLNIAGFTGGDVKILKTYEKEGYYISDVEIDDFTIYLSRMQHDGNGFVSASMDMIMNREADTNKMASIEKKQDEKKQTEVRIVLKKNMSEEQPTLLTPKQIFLEEPKEVVFEQAGLLSEYYVYADGKVMLATDKLSDAVHEANKAMGVVIDKEQRYVWKRAKKTIQTAFKDMKVGEEDKNAGSIARCINAMLRWEGASISVSALFERGETPQSVLSNTLRDVRVLDLTGAKLDDILYYISNGAPVFAMTDTSNAVLVIGYDAVSVSIFDPMSQTTYRKEIAEADAIFARAGSIFFTYLK